MSPFIYVAWCITGAGGYGIPRRDRLAASKPIGPSWPDASPAIEKSLYPRAVRSGLHPVEHFGLLEQRVDDRKERAR
jgi:hypothetical protein